MELVITIKAEPEEMDTALQAVSEFFARKLDDGKRTMTGAERTRKWREGKRDVSDDSVTKCDECDNSVTKCDEKTSQKKEKEEKKRTKRKEEKEINYINTSPDGEVQTEPEKPKATPEEPDFWKFAKENQNFAYQFFLETGVFPVKKEFGRWVNDLRNLAEAEITVKDMQDAVIYMRSNNLPIGAPGSILKTARWLKANPMTATRSNSEPKETWTEIADRIQTEMDGTDNIWGLLDSGNGEVIDV